MAPKGKGAVGTKNPQACVFCKTEEDDELKYGKLVHEGRLSVHHNCMFFASGLQQRSSSLSGLLGFHIADIRKEVRRGKKLRCSYCKQYGATVGCCISTCRKKFHLNCGMNSGMLNQYFGTFNSYCEVHKPVQPFVKTPKAAFHCHICYSSLSKRPIEDCLYVPCCKDNWYHKECIQKYATSAGGYFFSCPMCKNSSEFTKVTQTHGIHIPERDASWELEENAFQEHYQRPECGASPCHCQDGKNYDGDGDWELLFCNLCGSKATHRFCGKISQSVESWHCSECKLMEDQLSKQVVLPNVSPQESSQNKPQSIESQESFLSSKESPLNNIILSSHASSILSVASLDRALKCVVKVMPVKIVTDDNGFIRPLLRPNQEFVNVKPIAKVKATKHSKHARTHIRKCKIAASVKINKQESEKGNKNAKRKLTTAHVTNKKPCLREKVINAYNNEQSSKIKEKCTKANKKQPVITRNGNSKKGNVLKRHPKKINPIKFPSKCCSSNNCISKFFGFECPNKKKFSIDNMEKYL